MPVKISFFGWPTLTNNQVNLYSLSRCLGQGHQGKIEAEEVVGLAACNSSTASEDDDEIYSPWETALLGSQLLDDNNNLQHTQTKKQKSNDMAGAILQLASVQGKSTGTIASALKSVAEAISGASLNGIESVKVKVDGMENTLTGLGSKLDNILEKLLN